MRKLACLTILVLALLLNACSDGGSDSPSDTNAHPDGWFTDHAEAALATQTAGLDNPPPTIAGLVEALTTPTPAFAASTYPDCESCHGLDLRGSGDADSCYSCHSYNVAPPFTSHPEEWSDPYTQHGDYVNINGTGSCTACHGDDLQGRQSVPSCFAASFDGLFCHPNGPGESPHPDNYRSGGVHGPDAKDDLTICQACHGEPSVATPDTFVNFEFCQSTDCHDPGYAHPTNWAGPNTTFHYTAGNLPNACNTCHGSDLLDCTACHNDVSIFTLDCTACHGSTDFVPSPVDHRNAPIIGPHDVCAVCHGMKPDASRDGFLPVSANYKLFDKTNDINGDHWDGNIDMNSNPQVNYVPAEAGCTAICHGLEFILSSSGLDVDLKDFGSAGESPHPPDFINVHGKEAKNDLTICQACHGEPSTATPDTPVRFLDCESASCHAQGYAHPADWAGPNATFHYSAGNIQVACTTCHGSTLAYCSSCHDNVSTFSLDCEACHGYPPDGSPDLGIPTPVNHAGVPSGPHDVCAECHGMKSDGSGGFSPYQNYDLFDGVNDTNGDHWDGNMNMNSLWSYSRENNDCASSCHGSGESLPNSSGLPLILEEYRQVTP